MKIARGHPPKGYYTASQAKEKLNNGSDGMLRNLVQKGKIEKYIPPGRKQGFYNSNHVDKLAEERGQINEDIDVLFSPATINDLEKITQLSAKLFKTATLTPISTERRKEWFQKEPKGHYIVKKPNGDVVAYLHIVALTDEHIEAYMRNEFRGRDITGEMVQKLEPGKPIGCIVVSIGSDPSIKKSLRHRHTSILLRGVSNEITELGKQGIIIPRLYAYTESKSGILLCVRMKMWQYAEPIKRHYTYWLDVLQSSIPLLKGYQR